MLVVVWVRRRGSLAQALTLTLSPSSDALRAPPLTRMVWWLNTKGGFAACEKQRSSMGVSPLSSCRGTGYSAFLSQPRHSHLFLSYEGCALHERGWDTGLESLQGGEAADAEVRGLARVQEVVRRQVLVWHQLRCGTAGQNDGGGVLKVVSKVPRSRGFPAVCRVSLPQAAAIAREGAPALEVKST